MAAEPRKRSSWVGNVVLSVIAFALLAFAIGSNREQIAEVFRRGVDLPLASIAFAVYMVALVITFARWFVLVRALDLPFRLRDAIRLGFIGNVFNLVIPGAVGGDVIKAAFLCREQERKTLAISSMVIDRVVGLLALFYLASIAGLGGWSSADTNVRTIIGVCWAAAAVGTVGTLFLFSPALFRLILALVAHRPRLRHAVGELVVMAQAYRARPGVVLGTIAFSMLSHGLFVLSFYLVGRAIYGASLPTLAQHMQVVPLILFSTAAPIPFGAMGVSEGVSSLLMKSVNHPNGAIGMMAYRVLMYLGGAVSVLVYLANLAQVRTLQAATTPAAEPTLSNEPSGATS